MFQVSLSLLLFVLLIGCFWVGQTVRPLLRDDHRSRESVDSIRVVITLLVTFAALVLGLLISSSEARFSALRTGLQALSRNITELDQDLRDYGPTVDPLRADLITYTKAAIADTWPDEPAPMGDYPRRLNPLIKGGLESLALGGILNKIDLGIRHLTPENAFEQSVADSLRTRITVLREKRWELIENGVPSISWPFLAIINFWLAVIFLIAGLSSPRNLVMTTVTALAALSLASSIFLALDFDEPLTGLMKISSGPLRDALVHITQPPLPR